MVSPHAALTGSGIGASSGPATRTLQLAAAMFVLNVVIFAAVADSANVGDVRHMLLFGAALALLTPLAFRRAGLPLEASPRVSHVLEEQTVMRAPNRWTGVGRWVALGVALAAGTGELRAQQPAQPDSVVMPAVSDSFLVLVTPRDTGTIQQEVNAAVQRRAIAENARLQAEGLRGGARLRIEDMKRAIGAIDDRVNLAKKEKREGDVAKLTAARATAEREKSLLERRSSLRDAEIDLQKKRTENADLDRKMLELELQLAMKRAARPAPAPGNLERRDYDQGASELEQRVLEAQRAYAANLGEVADGEKRVVERRLALLDAQRKVATGSK
jgi:hypothetical protein